jgi:hypothetical protein
MREGEKRKGKERKLVRPITIKVLPVLDHITREKAWCAIDPTQGNRRERPEGPPAHVVSGSPERIYVQPF